jgi:hypothetical protein
MYASLVDGTYDCVDRIVLNAYFRFTQSPAGSQLWWRDLRGLTAGVVIHFVADKRGLELVRLILLPRALDSALRHFHPCPFKPTPSALNKRQKASVNSWHALYVAQALR